LSRSRRHHRKARNPVAAAKDWQELLQNGGTTIGGYGAEARQALTFGPNFLEAAEADYSSATAQLRASAFIRRRGDPILRT
jgi:hypothetical protein